MVAGHVLLGVAFGVAYALALNGVAWYRWQQQGALPSFTTLARLDTSGNLRTLLDGLILPVAILLGLLSLFILLRMLVRNTWATAAVLVGIFGVLAPENLNGAAVVGVLLWLTLRFGILPAAVMFLFEVLVGSAPMTPDLSAWYAPQGLLMIGLTLALAVSSFRHALGGRKVLAGDFLER
jgi:hypothetical protein